MKLSPNFEPKVDFVDFFSGCGGMSYGFHSVGKKTGFFNWCGAFDIDPFANETYEANFGSAPLPLDLSDDVLPQIKKTLIANGRQTKRPLVVIGCAPCQGFSSHRKKDQRKDSRNTFVGKFAEIATALDADIIIMENVPDILAKKHWHHFSRFKEVVESHGYQLQAEIINMALYGVPQERFRAVVIASKKHNISFPSPTHSRNEFKTVRDAIAHLRPLHPKGGMDPLDSMHKTSNHRDTTVVTLSKIPKNGGSRPRGVGPKCLDKVAGFYDVYGRLWWDRPAITITARCRTPSCGRFTHPEQNRGLSIREAALLQGFPNDFVFKGPFDDCYKQIGNAVPPPFSAILAEHISKIFQKKTKESPKGSVDFNKPKFASYSVMIAHQKGKMRGANKHEIRV
jgi:DNA (cytosine-5)-methyltransferase 1